MVRHASRPVSDAIARGRSPASAAKLLLRSARPFERAGGAGALELVGIAAVLYLRFCPEPREESDYGARRLRGDCRELNVPLDFPGSAAGYAALSELSDATCLAEAIVFISTHDSGKNAAFNITNGDSFRWCQVWPLLAQWFGMPCGVPRRIKLARWMADKGPVWDRIVARHGLEPRSLESLASWEFADFVFAKEWDLLTDTGRLRRAGFNACVDTIAMIRDQLDQYRDARLLPR
jgi:hypothetical protein